MLSTEQFDYSPHEELDYFAKKLRALRLGVICLQESHTNHQDSLAERLAQMLGMPHMAGSPGCPSHIDPQYRLTTAVLSQEPFVSESSLLLPEPNFELKFIHNNKVVEPYDRHVQIVRFGAFTVANMHTEPLGAFGKNYETGDGKQLATAIDSFLADKLQRPLLFAADFNMHKPPIALPTLIGALGLQEALPNRPTKPRGGNPDHILYSPEWRVVDAGIVTTQSDHFLCWAELEQ